MKIFYFGVWPVSLPGCDGEAEPPATVWLGDTNSPLAQFFIMYKVYLV